MIRIDTSKIKKWDEIKTKHLKYVEEQLKKSKEFKTLDDKIKNIIEDNIDNLAIGEIDKLDMLIKIINKCLKVDNECELELLVNFINCKCRKNETIINKMNEIFKGKESFVVFINNLDNNIKEFIKDRGDNKQDISQNEKYLIINKNYFKFSEQINIMNNLAKIFDYDKFLKYNKKSNMWDRHNLIAKMGISVCPYCNRNYISNYFDVEKEKATADLDHFYPKSKYPYLGLSLYNFIPCCQICNSRFKLDKDFKDKPHIYPYRECFDDYNVKFQTKPTSGVDYLKGTSTEFDLVLDPKGNQIVINSIETFKLEKLYKNHREQVQEIIQLVTWYNKDKIESIYGEYPELFENKYEVLNILFKRFILEVDTNIRPLDKLTKDILDEFGIEL